MDTVQRGDYVQYMFDTGAFGLSPIIGVITEAGPLAVTIRWESGLTNRVLRTAPRGVFPLRSQDLLEPKVLEALHGS